MIRGLPASVPARGLDPWRRPKGSWALGTRMILTVKRLSPWACSVFFLGDKDQFLISHIHCQLRSKVHVHVITKNGPLEFRIRDESFTDSRFSSLLAPFRSSKTAK